MEEVYDLLDDREETKEIILVRSTYNWVVVHEARVVRPWSVRIRWRSKMKQMLISLVQRSRESKQLKRTNEFGDVHSSSPVVPVSDRRC